MNRDDREAAKSMKTEKDLCDFTQMLTKITVEAALNTELDNHLGYSKHDLSIGDNNRNDHTTKILRTKEGQF